MYRRTNVIYRVVDALFRNRNLVLITLLCVAIPVALLLIFKSKGYTASAAVSVAQEGKILRENVGANIDQSGWKSAAEVHVANLTTLMKDVRQGGFVDKVFQGAALNHPISLAPGNYDKRIEAFLSGFTIKTDGDNLFTISLNWEDGDECKKLVKAIQDQYILETVRSKQVASQSGVVYYQKQIEQVEQKMTDANVQLERFRKLHPELGPTSHEVITDRIGLLEDRLQRAQLALVEGGERQTLLAPRLSQEKRFIDTEAPSVLGSSDSTARKHLQELEDRRSQLTSGDSPYSTTSDTIRALDQQIDRARLDVKRDQREKVKTGGVTRRVNPHYAELADAKTQSALTAKTAKLEIAQVTQQIVAAKKELKDLPALQNRMNDLDFKATSIQNDLGKLRTGLQNALQKDALEKDLASQTLKVVGEVYAASLSGPKKRIQLGFVSLILGAVVAALMVALREWADPTIRYETDIEQALDIPVLTGLPDTRAVLAPKSIEGSRRPGSKSRRPRALLPSEEL
jgi:uncharacterized protein involved in exopolysaccharide biosynthesis